MRLALLQCQPTRTPSGALTRLEDAAREAAAGGADLMMTPEMFLTGYTVGRDALDPLEAAPDEGLWAEAAAIARAHLPILTTGPLPGHGNGAVLFDADGEIRTQYRKAHLYGDVDAAQFTQGDRLSEVFDFAGLRCALAICFDIEFPELARTLARRGAELLLVPTANMHPYTGVATRLVPARAQENGLAIAYANYTGPDGTFDYCGLSCIVGPDGADLARAGDAAGLVIADITRDDVTRVRADLDYLSQTRTELYT
ncbi:nitrilase-related carbon-nitrogen hydrolase [Roseobacter sp. HKCCA0434]|uniref:nitrilase-related carbon-nitrogen hydrolase n=1 Tax=Roseobacter sp. HKCCA0434 TaxID=3079297 RepID=UPI002905AB25|nr:nitrilase-related carbon-nitrogen hydrolase [Roseobacter sp. HKCCA0434]